MALQATKQCLYDIFRRGSAQSISHRCLVIRAFEKTLTGSSATFSSSSKMQVPSLTPAPEALLKPLEVPAKLLMGPGPSNCPPRVLAAGALPMLGHLHPEFTKIMDEVKEGIQYAFQTKNEWTFALSGTGHAAMEASVVNLLEPGEVALVCQNGIWGQRLADMVERNGSVAKKIVRPMGEVFTLEEIEKGLKEHKPVLLFATYGESSAGTAQPLEGLGDLCHKYNCLLLVDSVAILGGRPLYMDAWNIDVLYSGSQKVLSSPPATSPISFSQRARDKITSRKTRIRSYYFDSIELANYWGCDEGPRRYHHTGMVTSVYALREGLARLAEIVEMKSSDIYRGDILIPQGLEKSWQDHKECSEQLYKGLEALGLELVVQDKKLRNPCVTTIWVPDGVNWKQVTDYAMSKYRVEISGGLGELAGKVWRIGVMGYNCTPENIKRVLVALEEGIANARK